MINTANQRGAEAESMFCTWALSEGYNVSFPARGLAPPYDCVLETGSTFQRIQVKRAFARLRDGREELGVRLTNRNDEPYTADQVDAFGIVDVDTGRVWLVPLWYTDGCTSLGLTNGKHDKWLVSGGKNE